jgi:hypothetical protein
MQEPSKPSNTTDELSAEFDAIVAKEQTSEQQEEAVNETAVPVTVKKREVSEPARPEPIATAPSESTVPVTDPVATPVVSEHINTPGSLILQWLTYAFWGWFAVAMVWLVGVVISWMVDRNGISNSIAEILPYPMAASIILLLIALAVDFFYSRVEPVKKKGAASVIMIIHAVIFALCGIGALIAAVFAVIYSMLNAGVFGGADGSKVIIFTSLIMMVIYALLTLRTVFGPTRRMLRFVTWGVLTTLLVIMAGIGILGPVADAIVTRQDRLIESALPRLASSIDSYAEKNKKLPASLSEVAASAASYRSEEVKELVTQNLVRYTPNTKPTPDQKPLIPQNQAKSGVSIDEYYGRQNSYYYRLCVTYKKEKKSSYSSHAAPASDGSLTYIDTSSHPAGEQCYDMKTETYGYALGN